MIDLNSRKIFELKYERIMYQIKFLIFENFLK